MAHEKRAPWREQTEENLREVDYRALVEQIPALVVYVRELGEPNIMTYLSSQTEAMLGYSPDELKGEVRRWLGILHPNDRDRVAAEAARAVSASEPFEAEYRCIARDGRVVWVRDQAITVRDQEGRPQSRWGVLFDVTEHKRIEEEPREDRARFGAVFEDVAIGIALVDMKGRIRESNPALREMLGYDGEELRGMSFTELDHPEDAVAVALQQLYEELLEGDRDRYQVEKRYVKKDGVLVWGHLTVSLVRDAGGEPRFAIYAVQDTTGRRALEEQLKHRAFHDPLTNLPNRDLFMDRLEHALARIERREKPIAVLFLDLDNFKFVNDSFGHGVGDRLLIAVADRLQGCVRPEDTVARLGGDEFTILLEEVGEASGAIRVAERIMEALREPFEFEEHQLLISASIGIVLGTTAQDRPEDLLRNADLTMYGVKNKGKARYEVFNPEINYRFGQRSQLENDLRQALERDEFVVLYQPKIQLRTGEIAGMEALVRWEHPERGLLPPSEFVPLAEETDFIIPIGYKVLEEACRQVRVWQERHPDDPAQTMYINLSSRQFNNPRLVEEITRIMHETGVEPRSLALEISESVLMGDAESVVTKLRALTNLGLRIVVDDFGTAYSSLSCLGHFPINSLNVDRSLIFKLGVDFRDTAIVSAAINLAHALGWEVTAEGVETADQLARLRELGCDMAQGYHLWEPLTSEQASASLASMPR